jgi:hypothetical protein
VFATAGSIATHIASKWILPTGVSGALVDTVNLQRIKVQNFVGTSINANNISEEYQDIITDFSKADALEEAFAWSATIATSGGVVIVDNGTSTSDKFKLGDLDINEEGKSQTNTLNFLLSLSKDTPTKLREIAMNSMNNLSYSSSYYKALG